MKVDLGILGEQPAVVTGDEVLISGVVLSPRLQAKALRGVGEERPTDTQILNWLLKRVEYLEHSGPNGENCRDMDSGSYWPQTFNPDDELCPAVEALSGLDLRAYVEAMITQEAKNA